MRKLFIFLYCSLFFYCTVSPPIEIKQLSGYWEIEFITQEGETFIPKANAPLYDHYILDNDQGVLNKVASHFGGSFSTSKDITSFQIEKLDKNHYIRFKTRWDEWSQKINHLDSQKLILENNKRLYHYKRPTAIIP